MPLSVSLLTASAHRTMGMDSDEHHHHHHEEENNYNMDEEDPVEFKSTTPDGTKPPQPLEGNNEDEETKEEIEHEEPSVTEHDLHTTVSEVSLEEPTDTEADAQVETEAVPDEESREPEDPEPCVPLDPPGEHASERPISFKKENAPESAKTNNTRHEQPFYKDKIFCIVTGILLVVLIAAAVVITVVALNNNNNESSSSDGTDSNNSPSSPTSAPSSMDDTNHHDDDSQEEGSFNPIEQTNPDFQLFGFAPEARFGTSLACTTTSSLDFTYVCVVGAPQDDGTGIGLYPGYVRVLQYNSNTTQSWIPVGSDMYGMEIQDRFGWTVDINRNGTIIAVGAPNADYPQNDTIIPNAGMVQVLEWDGSSWNPRGQTLYGSWENDFWGYSVSLSGDGNILAVGTPTMNQVHVYELLFNDNTTAAEWRLMGDPIGGVESYEGFGQSVVLSKSNGRILAVGAPGANDATGIVRLYEWTEDQFGTAVWTPKGNDLLGEAPSDGFGQSISLSWDGSTVAIGAPSHDNQQLFLEDTGQVQIYEWTGENWMTKGNIVLGTIESAYLGYSISLQEDGNIFAAGAWGSTEFKDLSESGSVRLWKWNGSTWEQHGSALLGDEDTDSNDNLGYAVALASKRNGELMVAAGAPLVDSGGLDNVGRVRIWRYSSTDASNPVTEQDHADHHHHQGF